MIGKIGFIDRVSYQPRFGNGGDNGGNGLAPISEILERFKNNEPILPEEAMALSRAQIKGINGQKIKLTPRQREDLRVIAGQAAQCD